jgi:hypothetical protein
MISSFIRAHGYTPGPTQRPIVAGIISGAIALVPALMIASIQRVLSSAAISLGAAESIARLGYAASLIAAGALYGWIFMRAANDRRGGWLFGIAYGFLAWTLGPSTLALWVTGRPLTTGVAAQLLLLAYLAYGLSLGVVYPHVGAFVRKRQSAASRKL